MLLLPMYEFVMDHNSENVLFYVGIIYTMFNFYRSNGKTACWSKSHKKAAGSNQIIRPLSILVKAT